MSRRILFAIRSKLGDTLISYQAVRAYADAHPRDEVTLITRAAYANLLRDEAGIRVIGFSSRISMAWKLLWMRCTRPAFDVLAVLWGSGPRIARLGALTHARRKIAWTNRFAPRMFEQGALRADHWLIDPAVSVIRAFEPGFEAPRALAIPSLQARYWRNTGKRAIGIVPVADEARRNMDAATLAQLLTEVWRRHPGAPLRIFVNPDNVGLDALAAVALPPGCEVRKFTDLRDLVEQYMELAAWYGTDTGLYHLAVAIGIPATVFFGPTQPHKIVMPGQPGTRVYRLAALGDSHCDEKSCGRPLCLHASVAVWCGVQALTRLTDTAPGCPLRALPPAALTENRDASPA